uniref:DNA polymerase theta n=1 Tax=Aceria tosichella TaxID=561515 RepID=A0A6G1SF02_9ACAR
MATALSPRTLKCQLSEWGLPPLIVAWFRKKGITSLFEWQVECLCQGDVLFGGNLVYSAPTSAGKTLVADFLLIKRVLEYNKKALVIEPFVALTREKAATLKSMLFTTKARVGAFGGAYYTPGGMAAVNVGVCTIEKANNFINKLINENKLSDLGIIVVDEIHYLGDERRGHQLELLLTKVLYYNSKQTLNKRIQIVGLSATIPNLKTIATWLQASLYVTEYRPVPLIEKIKIGDKLFDVKSYLLDPNCKPIETIEPSRFAIEKDFDDLYCLCLDTIIKGHSALVFCESKRECEIMATGLAEQIIKSGNLVKSKDQQKACMAAQLRDRISISKIKEILTKLDKCPAGKDTDLVKALRMGVGFHHAGLTMEEREIVEDGFKNGVIKTLMATSTLSSGVNLPARLVIVRSPMMISSNGGTFQREMLNPITYRQMIGRAGRKNIDTCGESILVCRPDNHDVALKLLQASLGNINSSLAHRLMGTEGEPSGIKKALLEVIANGTAVTRPNINKYLKSTFWLSSEDDSDSKVFKDAVTETLRFLTSKKFIEELTPGCYKPTRLGNAVLNSGIHPDESLELIQDLMKARQGFCLLNDLHIIYQVTPNDIARSADLKDWQHYSKIWNDLDDICQYVGERVGIDELVIARRARGFSHILSDDKERVYRRFWVALIINDLVKEMQLFEICKKFRMSKAFVQQAQRAVAQFAGVISIFCQELGYENIAALVTPLESRINFSCQRDLLDLIRLNITRPIARGLYNSGYRNIIAVAKGDKLDIEFVIRQLAPFKKESSFTETDAPIMWVPELAKNMSTLDYANYIVDCARDYVEIEYDLDINSMLEKKKDDEIQRQTQEQSNQASPVKRARLENGIYQTRVKNLD